MSDNFKYAQLQPYTLSGAGAVIGDTSITLKSMKDIDGNALTMSGTFGSIGFGTLEPGNGTLEEQICFTGLTNNSNGTVTLTGIKSVTFTSPYTQTSGLLKTHAGSTTFVISNTSGFYDELTSKNDDETIAGTWTFTAPNYPQIDTPATLPTLNAQFATKQYVDGVAVAGAPNANTTTKGIVQIATQAQVDAGTAVGSTSAYIVATPDLLRSKLLSDYVVDTSGSVNVIKIAPSPAITAYTAGQIFTTKVALTNTSTTPSVNVNGLGQKNIAKLNGSSSPAVGDLAAGQMIVLEYDGTNFQMVSPVANEPATLTYVNSTYAKFGGTGADGALTLTSGITTQSAGNAATLVKNYTTISITGTAVVNFSNPNTNGTTVIWKSQGDVTITSSTSPCVNVMFMGAAGGSGPGSTSGTQAAPGAGGGASMINDGSAGSNSSSSGSQTGGSNGSDGFGVLRARAGQTSASNSNIAGVGGTSYGSSALTPYAKSLIMGPGSGGGAGAGGGSGTGNGGTGGIGGGALYIECGGNLNVTGTIVANGSPGAVAQTNGGSGGGGGAGTIVILYKNLTANSGTYGTTGGAGGASGGSGGAGGKGGDGYSTVAKNTEFD